ncbi:MAG: hypothetical protein ACKVQS_14280 [Fimbriimonadaceae bacterium]
MRLLLSAITVATLISMFGCAKAQESTPSQEKQEIQQEIQHQSQAPEIAESEPR